jgi:hypothetical protein
VNRTRGPCTSHLFERQREQVVQNCIARSAVFTVLRSTPSLLSCEPASYCISSAARLSWYRCLSLSPLYKSWLTVSPRCCHPSSSSVFLGFLGARLLPELSVPTAWRAVRVAACRRISCGAILSLVFAVYTVWFSVVRSFSEVAPSSPPSFGSLRCLAVPSCLPGVPRRVPLRPRIPFHSRGLQISTWQEVLACIRHFRHRDQVWISQSTRFQNNQPG